MGQSGAERRLPKGVSMRRRRTTVEELWAFQWPGTRSKYTGGTGLGRLAFPVLHVQPYSVPLAGEGSWTVAAGRHLAAVASTAALDQIEVEPQRRRATANLFAAGLSLCDLAVADSRQR